MDWVGQIRIIIDQSLLLDSDVRTERVHHSSGGHVWRKAKKHNWNGSDEWRMHVQVGSTMWGHCLLFGLCHGLLVQALFLHFVLYDR